jgi:hypothetical protein
VPEAFDIAGRLCKPESAAAEGLDELFEDAMDNPMDEQNHPAASNSAKYRAVQGGSDDLPAEATPGH